MNMPMMRAMCSHGLEHADLRALLIDHARHRGHAHQRRDHEEEQREDQAMLSTICESLSKQA